MDSPRDHVINENTSRNQPKLTTNNIKYNLNTLEFPHRKNLDAEQKKYNLNNRFKQERIHGPTTTI